MKTTRALLASLLLAATSVAPAATITIINADPAGVGFNDPTPAAPVGGNMGMTIGEQRLNVYNYVAGLWGAALPSTVEIRVRSTWEALTCAETSAVLGSAGTNQIFHSFTNAPFTNTWYHSALADKLAGSDLGPGLQDINARFNVNLGTPGCLTASGWYYGFDANEPAGQIDFATVLLHELGHGLGFSTFVDGSSGNFNAGRADIFARNLKDVATGRQWTDALETSGNRLASITSGVGLVWTGPNVTAWAAANLTPRGRLLISAGSPASGNYYVGAAAFGAALSTPGVTGAIVAALDPADGAGPTTFDACSPLTNAGAVNGNIALVDRGTCSFTIKVKNCQDAGATAVLVADNVAGVPPPTGLAGTDPTITIPSVRLTQANGATIRANLPLAGGATANLALDPATKAGADASNNMLMFAPDPRQPGSSTSHFDVSATPNVLMEPAINADLTHNVASDSTFAQMKDIGWLGALPNPAPTVSSVVPACASTVGGRTITVNGTGFLPGATVSLLGTACAVTNVTPTAITCTAGARANAPSAIGNVVVTNLDLLSGTLTNGFNYALRGDTNNNGALTGADAFYLNLAIFLGGSPVVSLCQGDVNSSGAQTGADTFFLNMYIFLGGTAPGP
ncbi:MAG: IPT/TIG domain-containing protein [Acidobacteria bacterium]|nr:IPT/TIG domain-containing protein [Acidobacteriota bacterium]